MASEIHTRVYWSFKNVNSSYLEAIKAKPFQRRSTCPRAPRLPFYIKSALLFTSFSSLKDNHLSSIFMEEVDESEANWFDGSVEELIHELLDDESPLFVPPEVPESQQLAASQKSVINKLISSVYSGPTIGDIQSALSMGFQHGRSGSHAVISFPEKGSGKMENKYTLRIKSCENGLTPDGYKWRKYGQKSIKNNPNPRSFLFFNVKGGYIYPHPDFIYS